MRTRDLDTLLENEYPYEPPIQLIEMSHHNTNPIFTHMKQNVLTAGQRCLVSLLLLVLTSPLVRSFPAYSKPRRYHHTSGRCLALIFSKQDTKVLLDAELPMKEKYQVIQFFLSKVEEECDNIHSS